MICLVRMDRLGTAVVHARAEVRVPLGSLPNVPAASREPDDLVPSPQILVLGCSGTFGSCQSCHSHVSFDLGSVMGLVMVTVVLIVIALRKIHSRWSR